MTNTIHSKFLIHWTGRDINPYDREIDGDIRKKYIERLKNIIEKGLYFYTVGNINWSAENVSNEMGTLQQLVPPKLLC